MTCYELSEMCQKTLDAVVLMHIDGQWLPVTGLKATGEHRNAVAIKIGKIDGLDETRKMILTAKGIPPDSPLADAIKSILAIAQSFPDAKQILRDAIGVHTIETWSEATVKDELAKVTAE
ncbi:MAG TPA: hypothetical protein VNT76_00350 [Candidatus Binatus sp.]|nr:hypothetical protein [Candidatus Binatus sp.]